MKQALITGANRGIGLELTKECVARGYHVTALCRQSSDDLDQCSQVTVIEGVDLMDSESIQRACLRIKADRIDLLINNAGRMRRTAIDAMDTEAATEMMSQYQINAMAPVLLTSGCYHKLGQGSKVVLITSRMGSIADNQSGSHYAYRMSKAALNMAGKSLAIDCAQNGVAVAILHPGWIKTGMTGHTGNDTAETAASQLLERIEQLTLNNTGTFWHANGESLPW